MNSSHTGPRATPAILAEISAIQNPVAGTLSQVARTLKNGETATYHILQYWEGRRHVSVYVPPDKLAEIRQGVERNSRLKALFNELAQNGRDAVLSGNADDPVKKKRRR